MSAASLDASAAALCGYHEERARCGGGEFHERAVSFLRGIRDRDAAAGQAMAEYGNERYAQGRREGAAAATDRLKRLLRYHAHMMCDCARDIGTTFPAWAADWREEAARTDTVLASDEKAAGRNTSGEAIESAGRDGRKPHYAHAPGGLGVFSHAFDEATPAEGPTAAESRPQEDPQP